MRTRLSSLGEAALEYAARDWHVLPLVPHKKNPITKNGLLDSNNNEEVIVAWWTAWPNANIGLRTGIQFDVLDIDGDVGRASLAAKAGPGIVHPGPVSRTSSARSRSPFCSSRLMSTRYS